MDNESKNHVVMPAELLKSFFNDADYDANDKWRNLDPRRSALILVDLINW
jgi:hypothetical protein